MSTSILRDAIDKIKVTHPGPRVDPGVFVFVVEALQSRDANLALSDSTMIPAHCSHRGGLGDTETSRSIQFDVIASRHHSQSMLYAPYISVGCRCTDADGGYAGLSNTMCVQKCLGRVHSDLDMILEVVVDIINDQRIAVRSGDARRYG
jgi:hypothetical protein